MPNFKSKASYGKWLAYGHAHKKFENTPGNQPVSINGKKKKVNHSTGSTTKKSSTSSGRKCLK